MNDQAQLNFLKSQNLLPEHVFLDFDSGEQGGVSIVEYLNEGNYFGIDTRIRILVDGQRNMKAAGLRSKNPHFIHMDTYEALPFSERFDVIGAFSVFTHFNDHQAEKALNFIGSWLKINGKFYANVNIGQSSAQESEGLTKSYRPQAFYEEIANKTDLQMTVLGRLNDLGFDNSAEEIMLSFCKEK